MAAITSSGVGSGLDIQSLVAQLVSAERAPEAQRIFRQESQTRTEISAYGQLRSAMAGLQSSLSASLNDGPADARAVALSSEDYFSAEASTGSSLGNFDIIVERLAGSGRSVLQTPTDPAAGLGVGTFDLTLGADSFSVNIADAGTTLAELRDAINEAVDNPGIRASIINVDGGSVLSLSSDRIGADSAISLSGTGEYNALAADFNAVELGQDALIQIDGMPVTSSSNTISDAIDGVSLTLLKADATATTNLGVSRNDTALSDAINEFVTAWNTFASKADTLSEYNPNTGNGGPLNGNALLRGIEARLRSAVSEGQGDGGDLFGGEFGLSFDSSGKLSLDSAQLTEALSERRADVTAWWSGDTGLATKLDSVLDSMLDDESSLSSREVALEAKLTRLDEREERLDLRMERVEARYLKQFTALDVALAQLQSTSSFLSAQLGSLLGPSA